MTKLILRCGLAPGDVVMLTAAVRDLHRCYPRMFQTDVRTLWPDLWANNPYLTPLAEEDKDVRQLECSYPLINECNETPYHCLHGFIQFLNQKLGLQIRPTAFRGDIHLSALEKSWHSQVYELTGKDIPFWIVSGGGKYDVTVKWWDQSRYQAVVDHFREKIQFVQIGHSNHHHPKLEGAIDLRGRTSLRELVRLVYHSDGVLCPVTAVMHLAAAVPRKTGGTANRPCVVVAGGREPAHWEAYPGHQFLHTNDALRCCAGEGCWRDRTIALRDGDPRDRVNRLCVDVVGELPRCMDMIQAKDVIRCIELYYQSAVLKPLTGGQRAAAERGVARAAKNPVDRAALHIHNAGMKCDAFIRTLPANSPRYDGRGIVICGGGVKYFTNAWVCINMLRRLGCALPIQLWHLGTKECDATMRALVSPLGVECLDAHKLRRKFPMRILRGWELKPYAILHSPFRQVLFLDADNVPVVNPEFLFDTAEFQRTGAVFWPDYWHGKNKVAATIWKSCGLRQPSEPEFETGQIVLDKQRCWHALRLALWFNENSDFYYAYVHGDKETFHLAFRKLGKSYSLVPKRIYSLERTMCQHDFQGRRIFQHRNCDKWDLLLSNKRIRGFEFENECRQYIAELQHAWDGGMSRVVRAKPFHRPRPSDRSVTIKAVILSGSERNKKAPQTLLNLEQTDWGDEPLQLGIHTRDKPTGTKNGDTIESNSLRLILEGTTDYLLFLTCGLELNRHLRHNLSRWVALRSRTVDLATIYNPRLREVACDVPTHTRVISPHPRYEDPALIISRAALRHLVGNGKHRQRFQVCEIPKLLARWGNPVQCHAPSLAQRRSSTPRAAFDFDANWKA